MKQQTNSRPALLIFLAFFSIYFVWGTTYLASIIGLQSIKPFVLSTLRYTTAALLLGTYLLATKQFRVDRRSVPVLLISGTLMLVGGSGFVVYGEQYVNSGYAAVIVATEPLWFILLDRKRWPLYLGNRGVIIGLLGGFAGILLFAWLSPAAAAVTPGGLVPGTAILLVSAILWVAGSLYANKRLPADGSNVSNTTVQLFSGALTSAILALILGEWNTFDPEAVTTKTWLALAYLVVFGSLVAYVAYNWLLTVRPPAIVSTHTYVNPVVAVGAGWALADEHVSREQLFALGLVIIAVIITQVSKQRALTRLNLEAEPV